MEDTERSEYWFWSLKGLVCIIGVYSVLHILIRTLASEVIGQDDVVGNLFSQVLAAGYTPRQGPLYDWLLWGIQQVTGPEILSFLILKYVLVGSMLTFIFLAANEIFRSRMWALFTALSVSLMYQIGWNVHEGVTHTAALMAAISGTFWAFVRVSKNASLINYVILGVLLGLGFLSKHTFGVFPLILLICSMFQRSLRRVILNPLFIVSLISCMLVMSPYLAWLLQYTHELNRETILSTGVNGISYLERLTIGLPKVITSPIGFLFPLIIILPLVFPNFLKTWWNELRSLKSANEQPNYILLLNHMMLASLILITLAVLVLGITRFEERYMHPFFLVSVIGLVGIAMKSCTEMKILNRYITVMVVFAVVVMGIRVTNLVVGAPLCGKCREFVPYSQLAEILKEKGFRGGTIVTGYRHLAGNMRRLFPDSTIISVLGPAFKPPLDKKKNKFRGVVAVWDPKMNKGKLPGRIRHALAQLGIKDVPEVETVKVPWKHLWREDGYRYSVWKMVLIPEYQKEQKVAFPKNNR